MNREHFISQLQSIGFARISDSNTTYAGRCGNMAHLIRLDLLNNQSRFRMQAGIAHQAIGNNRKITHSAKWLSIGSDGVDRSEEFYWGTERPWTALTKRGFRWLRTITSANEAMGYLRRANDRTIRETNLADKLSESLALDQNLGELKYPCTSQSLTRISPSDIMKELWQSSQLSLHNFKLDGPRAVRERNGWLDVIQSVPTDDYFGCELAAFHWCIEFDGDKRLPDRPILFSGAFINHLSLGASPMVWDFDESTPESRSNSTALALEWFDRVKKKADLVGTLNERMIDGSPADLNTRLGQLVYKLRR